MKKILKFILSIFVFFVSFGISMEYINFFPVSFFIGILAVNFVGKLVSSKENEQQKAIVNYEIKPKALDSDLELKAMMDEAYKDLRKIQAVYSSARHEDIRLKGKTLFESGVSIFEYLKKNPSKIKLARRFLTYYLDTAAQIMTKYENFSGTELNSPEMDKIYRDTESALEILNSSFNKQLIKLMQNEIMDFEVDIRVLKDTLKEEG